MAFDFFCVKYCNSIVYKFSAVLLPMAFSYLKNLSIHTHPIHQPSSQECIIESLRSNFLFTSLCFPNGCGGDGRGNGLCPVTSHFLNSTYLSGSLSGSLFLSLPLSLSASASASEVAVLSRGDRVNHDWLAREEGDILIKRPQRCSAIMQIEC